MNKYLYGLLLILILSSSAIAGKLSVVIDEKDCVFKLIQYNDMDNLVWAVGNCQVLYDLCTEDFCKIERITEKELNFGTADNIGKR